MELKDYIAETLVQITNGFIEAQKQLKGVDVIVNPAKTFGGNGDFWIGKDQDKGSVVPRVQKVGMKIGVISTEETTGDGVAEVHLGVLNLEFRG